MSERGSRPTTLQVTLSRVDSQNEKDEDLRERKLILTSDKPVSIGRASKNHNKSLVAAKDNAWINSPVISREHAQLSTSSWSGRDRVYIRDNGSMHGTMVNTSQLGKDTDFPIKDGDRIQFGTVVVRDNESYPPPVYSIRYEKLPSTPTVIDLTQSDIPPKRYVVPSDSEASDQELEASGARADTQKKNRERVTNPEHRLSVAPTDPMSIAADFGDSPEASPEASPEPEEDTPLKVIAQNDMTSIAADFDESVQDENYRRAAQIAIEARFSRSAETAKSSSLFATCESEAERDEASHYTESEHDSDMYPSDVEGSSASDSYPEDDDRSMSADSDAEDPFHCSSVASSNASNISENNEDHNTSSNIAIQDLLHSSDTELSGVRPSAPAISNSTTETGPGKETTKEKFPKVGASFGPPRLPFSQERANVAKHPAGIDGRPTALAEYDDWSAWVPPPSPEQVHRTTGYGHETQKFLSPLPDYFTASEGPIPKYQDGPFSLSKNDTYTPPISVYPHDFRNDYPFVRYPLTRSAQAHLPPPPPPPPMSQSGIVSTYDFYPATTSYGLQNDRSTAQPSNSLYGGSAPLVQMAVAPGAVDIPESSREPAKPKAVLSIPDIVESISSPVVEYEENSTSSRKRKADKISAELPVAPSATTGPDLPTGLPATSTSAVETATDETASTDVGAGQPIAAPKVLASRKILTPRTRAKFHYAATVLGSAVLGGIATVVGLAALPENYFQ